MTTLVNIYVILDNNKRVKNDETKTWRIMKEPTSLRRTIMKNTLGENDRRLDRCLKP